MQAAERKRKRLATTLAAAVSHPLRSKILTILAERTASPVEIAREIGNVEVSKVGYHVTALADAGLTEEVGQRPVRGAVEHFYRATELPLITADQEAERSEAERRTFAETTLSIYAANAAHAIETGTLLARGDHHLTRHAFNIDEAGWAELTTAYMELFERVYEIQETAAGRNWEGKQEPVRVVSYLSLFEMPKPARE